MRNTRRREQGKGGLELIEEAVHLLRTGPAAALASYYLGTLPFVLGVLFFWGDMSRSPFAYQHLPGAALGLAALFLWMKLWQALFARRLRAQVTGVPAPSLGLRRCWRIFVSQAALQPVGLFVLFLASFVVLPFGWLYAFYQNVTALADGEVAEVWPLATKAWRQAKLWPGQNHAVLFIGFGFGSVVFLDWTIVSFVLPRLVKTLFGVESVFTRSGTSLLNTTFFAAMFCLTYLCVDPILKAVYVLRCFYGESLVSGEDLRADLRQMGLAAPMAAGLVALGLVVGTQAPVSIRWAAEIPLTPALSQGERENHSQCQPGSLRLILENTSLTLGGVVSGAGLAKQLSWHRPPTIPVFQHSNLPTILPFLWGEGRGEGSRVLPLHGEPRRFSNAHWDHEPGRGRLVPSPAFAWAAWGRDVPAPVHGKGEQGVQIGMSAAAEAENQSPSTSVSPPELDKAIQQVVQQRQYTWRMPREKIEEDQSSEQGVVGRFLQRVFETLKRWLQAFGRWLDNILRKLFARRRPMPHANYSFGWVTPLQVLLVVLLVAVVVALTLFFFRVWRERQVRLAPRIAEPLQPTPDLADENVGADQLPEDGWSKLARELLERGELRLALRAFYLASLAHLAGRNLISLAKFKSNRDYERELGRRGHSFPELLTIFAENVMVFDRIWYGLHEINRDLVSRFAENVARIKGGMQPE